VGAPSAALFGRAHETRFLDAAIRAVGAGRGKGVLLEGEAGIGKTALLEHVQAAARRGGLRLLAAAGDELEQRIPFAALRRCLGLREPGAGPTDARIADLLPAGPSPAAFWPPQAATAAAEAVTAAIGRWCAERPVALVLDDLHWVDGDTLLVLHHVARALPRLPVLLVMALRPLPASEELERFRRSADVREFAVRQVPPLDGPAVAQLVGHLAGAPADRRLLRFAAGASGNPLFIRELIRGLVDERRIGLEDGAAVLSAGGAALPASLTAAVRWQLAYMSEPKRELLSAAAALGASFTVAQVAAVSDLSIPELTRLLRRSVRHGLLESRGDRLAFRHDLVRRALHDELPAAVRSALLQQAAQAQGCDEVAPERIAQHGPRRTGPSSSRARDPLDPSGLRIARAVGRAGDPADRSWPGAADGGGRAAGGHPALALLRADRPAEAERAARATLALVAADDVRSQIRLRWILAQACFRLGRLDMAAAEVETVAALPGLGADQAALFHTFDALCHRYMGNDELCRLALKRAADAGSDDPFATAYQLSVLSGLELVRQRLDRALSLSAESLAVLGDRAPPADMQIALHLTHGINLLESDRFAESDEVLGAGMVWDENIGGTFTPVYRMMRVWVRFWDGRWDDCLAQIGAGEQAEDRLAMAQGTRAIGALVAAHRREQLKQLDLFAAPTLGGQYYHYVRQWAAALSAEADGDRAAALRELLDAWHRCPPSLMPLRYQLTPDIVRVAEALGDAETAVGIADEMTALESVRRTRGVEGTALLCRGLVKGEPDLLREAAGLFRVTGRRLFEGYALENEAVVLARAGRGERAHDVLSEALPIFSGLGAQWDVARAIARLRQEGVRVVDFKPRRRPKSGWDALTDTERRVAELVAGGLSNPQIGTRLFISRRTVQCHVSSILAKLSLKSRVELALAHSRHVRLLGDFPRTERV
jgi:DNA-binding CsgD family transcriptional regulator